MPEQIPSPPRVLLPVATPAEAKAFVRGWNAALAENLDRAEPWNALDLGGGIDLVLTGVGKANAAGAVARCLRVPTHRLVLNVGIAGALPALHPTPSLEPGALVVASACVFADEGLLAPEGFRPLSDMGFPISAEGDAIACDSRLAELLHADADSLAPIATVSTCSGTDPLARGVRERTGAIAEAMEGAAAALAASRLGVPMVELRAISNTTGNRASQRWDVPRAFARLSEAGSRIPRVLERWVGGHDLRGV